MWREEVKDNSRDFIGKKKCQFSRISGGSSSPTLQEIMWGIWII